MTQFELYAATALHDCRFLPGSFDKRWVKQLDNWIDRDMTDKGRKMLRKLVEKYRRQIPDHVYILNGLHNEERHRRIEKRIEV